MNQVKTIGITSPEMEEGKTLTSINLSFALAEDSTKRVALVDCDFRRPQVANYLNIREKGGLIDVIHGERALQDVMVSVGKNTTLDVFCAGRVEEEITPHFFKTKLAPVLENLTNIYDIIVADNPPILPISDEEFLADLLDAIVLVVRAGKTSRDLAQASLESMEGKNIVGVLLNGVEKQFSSSYSYGYFSKSYYRNGHRK